MSNDNDLVVRAGKSAHHQYALDVTPERAGWRFAVPTTPGGNWSSYPPHKHDLYYLNVMAGPAQDRTWLMTDDPAHHWIRDTWDSQKVGPRQSVTRPVNTDKDAQ